MPGSIELANDVMVNSIKIGSIEEIVGVEKALGVTSRAVIEEVDGEIWSGITSQPTVGETVEGLAE